MRPKTSERKERKYQRAAWYEVTRLGIPSVTQTKHYTYFAASNRLLGVPHYAVIITLGGEKDCSMERAFNLLHPYEDRRA